FVVALYYRVDLANVADDDLWRGTGVTGAVFSRISILLSDRGFIELLGEIEVDPCLLSGIVVQIELFRLIQIERGRYTVAWCPSDRAIGVDDFLIRPQYVPWRAQ